jgi:hypothetical protein
LDDPITAVGQRAGVRTLVVIKGIAVVALFGNDCDPIAAARRSRSDPALRSLPGGVNRK